MARVKGPLFSLEASGSVKKTIVYSKWKGRQYVRQHAIPLNPNSATQINVRKAWQILVAGWQAEDAPTQTVWNEFAKQFQTSGFNQYVKRGMEQYNIQLTTAVEPASTSVAGDPPVDVWTWVAV